MGQGSGVKANSLERALQISSDTAPANKKLKILACLSRDNYSLFSAYFHFLNWEFSNFRNLCEKVREMHYNIDSPSPKNYLKNHFHFYLGCKICENYFY